MVIFKARKDGYNYARDTLTEQESARCRANLFENISQADERNTKLVVDMSQTTSLPSIFLNVSIGRFIDARGKERLKETLTFANIAKSQATRLREYLNRYKSTESGVSFSGESRGVKENKI